MSGWTFASIQPVQSYAPAVRQAYFHIFAICLGVLAFGLALSYYLSIISYGPVRQQLVKLREFNSNLFPNQQHNEFKVFDHVLNGLNNRVAQLSGELNGNKLLALLYGQLTDNELREWLPQEARVIVVNLKLLKAGSAEPMGLQPGREQVDIVRLVRELSEKHVAPHHYEIVAISAKECSILYIVMGSEAYEARVGGVGTEAGSAPIREHLCRMIESGREKGATVVAGVGGIAASVEEIRIAHEQAARALKYTFIKDFDLNPVLHYSEICGRTGMPTIRYEPYEQVLRAGDPEAVDQFLRDFQEAMKRSDLPLEAIELSLLQMTVTLSKVMIDMNNTDPMFSSSHLFQQLIRDTFDESVAGIRDQSLLIAVHIQQHLLHNVQYDVVYKLKAYIDEHLAENISLDRLSELASLSSQYVSKQFKEVLQVSFIDYLTNARMERACQLLAGYELSVNEIAIQVGYNQTKYFCTKFKLKYGVTPMQYRKSFKRTPTEEFMESRGAEISG
jgi:two-component system, response regulator YesN